MAVKQSCRIIRICGCDTSDSVFFDEIKFFTDKRIIPGTAKRIYDMRVDSGYDFFKMSALSEDLLRAAELFIQVFGTYTSESVYSV